MVNIARKTSTLQYRQSIDCHNCGATNNIEEPWKKWIRNNDALDSLVHGISIMDTDMWVHKFGKRRGRFGAWDRDIQYLMKVEVKTHGANITAAQRDNGDSGLDSNQRRVYAPIVQWGDPAPAPGGDGGASRTPTLGG